MPQAGVGEATTTGGAQDGAAGQESAVAAVAVKVTGEPVRPAAVATKDCVPGAGPRVAVADAVPSDAVCETGAPTAPEVEDHAIGKPAIGAPEESVTFTTSDAGSGAPAFAV
ncbi:MAG: hypothetical protein E6J61_04480 [Deltaproteobacteria bacterium]|nr:MAG: hypothetical protein E6J61_04480 [Deltaproteobacteria bacterium]